MLRTSGDFADECDRMSNHTRWVNFCKTVWGPIQRHLGDQFKVIGTRLSQETVEILRESCGKFGNEMGSRMSLKDVQGGIISGVGNMAQHVGSNLTENRERNSKKEQVPTAICTEFNKITQVSTQSREEEAHNGIVTIDQKLNGLKAEVLTSANALIQNQSGQDWKDHESRVRHGRPKMPYHLWGGAETWATYR